MTSSEIPMPQSLDQVPCGEFLQFQQVLKRWRDVDDKVIYELNSIIPTQSFSRGVSVADKCKQFHEMLQHAYEMRDAALRKCMDETRKSVDMWKVRRDANDCDIEASKNLRQQQTNLRLLDNELTVDEVVRQRTLKAYSERCGMAYATSGHPKSS